MARRRGPTPEGWVGERLAAVGRYTAEPLVEHVVYTFRDLPELAADWCHFELMVFVPAGPTPADIDGLLERWVWYRPLHTAHSAELRAGVIDQYRACDDYLPRGLADADIVRQVRKGMIQLDSPADPETAVAELFVAFDGDHGPLFEWDPGIPGWSRTG